MKKLLIDVVMSPMMILAECGYPALPPSDFVHLMCSLGITRTEEEKRHDILWMKSLVEKYPSVMCDVPQFCEKMKIHASLVV